MTAHGDTTGGETSVNDHERAWALLELDRDAEARELVAALLVDDPDDPALLCMLAQSCLGTDDADAAATVTAKAIALEPSGEWALRLGAIAQLRLGKHDDARRLIARAVEADPGNWRTHYVQAQVGVLYDAVDGEAAAREAITLDPTNADCHEVLGDVLLARGRSADAGGAYRRALRLDPDHAGARHGLALVHSRRGDFGRAAAGFADAAAADPADWEAAANLVTTGARVIALVHWTVWYALGSAGFVTLDSGNRDWAVAGLTAVVAVLAVGAFSFWRGTRPRTMRLVGLIGRRDRRLAAQAGLLALSVLLFAGAAFGPPGLTAPLIGLSIFAIFVGAFVQAVGLRRLS